MEYIEKGLDALIELIDLLGIKSIALPPLGSGNGGLIWHDVKKMIEKKLAFISNEVDIFIFETSQNYNDKHAEEPKISLYLFILMKFKNYLKNFNIIILNNVEFI